MRRHRWGPPTPKSGHFGCAPHCLHLSRRDISDRFRPFLERGRTIPAESKDRTASRMLWLRGVHQQVLDRRMITRAQDSHN